MPQPGKAAIGRFALAVGRHRLMYNITRMDVYEGYKRGLMLYCKKQ